MMLKTLPYVLAVFAPLHATAAPQASWLSCAATPRNLIELVRDTVWPEGDVVVVEGFVKSVQDQDDNQHSITIQVRSTAPKAPSNSSSSLVVHSLRALCLCLV